MEACRTSLNNRAAIVLEAALNAIEPKVVDLGSVASGKSEGDVRYAVTHDIDREYSRRQHSDAVRRM